MKNDILKNEDTNFLTKEFVNTAVGFAYGEDANGDLKIILDQNNNLDFSDDKVYDLPSLSDFEVSYDDDQFRHINFTYEHFLNNEVVSLEGKVRIIFLENYNMLFTGFVEYGSASFNDQKIEIYGSDLSYNDARIFLVNEENQLDEKPSYEEQIQKGGYIIIDKQVYKNHGVNPNKDALVLEKMEGNVDEFQSAQVGFLHFPIGGKEFSTQETISTTNLTSAYTLLDFWATWCGPCIAEMPFLDSLYLKTSREDFEIIGLVGDSMEEDLENNISKLSITWPHLFLSKDHTTLSDYAIKGYPTKYLIDKNGKIVAKNLRGDKLEKRVFELLNNNH